MQPRLWRRTGKKTFGFESSQSESPACHSLHRPGRLNVCRKITRRTWRRSDIIVVRDVGHESLQEKPQRFSLAAAITRTVRVSTSIPCHRYGPARFVATEKPNITKDDDLAIVQSPCLPLMTTSKTKATASEALAEAKVVRGIGGASARHSWTNNATATTLSMRWVRSIRYGWYACQWELVGHIQPRIRHLRSREKLSVELARDIRTYVCVYSSLKLISYHAVGHGTRRRGVRQKTENTQRQTTTRLSQRPRVG
jgi:hypothetical protein